MKQVVTLIRLSNIELTADVSLPERAKGLVLFAHGSGSSRRSTRNRHVADILNRGAIGTVLTDLLTEEEEAVDIQTRELRFDIALLGGRVAAITDWIGRQPGLKNLRLGYFGASTGAAAALVAAAQCPKTVRAVVSRGGPARLGGAGAQGRPGADAVYRGRRRYGGPGPELRGDGSASTPDGTQARSDRRRRSPVRRARRLGQSGRAGAGLVPRAPWAHVVSPRKLIVRSLLRVSDRGY